MKFSTKVRYGLRILSQIGYTCQFQQSIRGQEVSKMQKISSAYVEQLLIPLKKSGLIKTIRGRKGGYMLGQDSELITVADVITVLDGDWCLADCEKNGKCCALKEICPTTEVWMHLSQKIELEASRITLRSIIEKMNVNSNLLSAYKK